VLFPETKSLLSSLAKAALPPDNRVANANAVIEWEMGLMTLSFGGIERLKAARLFGEAYWQAARRLRFAQEKNIRI
jgi:hypothetical protein